MQININVKDESRLDFLLQLLRELNFVEVMPMPNKNGHAPAIAQNNPTNELTAKQQVFAEGLLGALKEVELHKQGKIKLKTLEEALAEI